jgi:hypothetical protein
MNNGFLLSELGLLLPEWITGRVMDVFMWNDPLYQETTFWLHLLRSWLKIKIIQAHPSYLFLQQKNNSTYRKFLHQRA